MDAPDAQSRQGRQGRQDRQSTEGTRHRRPRARTLAGLLALLAGLLLLAHGRAQQQRQRSAGAQADANDARLLETGSANGATAPKTAPAEFKVVSYNIRWRGGAELRRLAQALREHKEIGGALVIGLQEVDRAKERTKNENGARVLADALGMHYAWAAPPALKDEEEETGVTLLSPYPLKDVTRLVLPHAGPGGRRRAAIGATVQLGDTTLRVYSVHAETRLKVARKLEQQRAVLEDLQKHREARAAVVLGDFNTWEPQAADDTVRLFKEAGFTSGINNTPSTFRRFILELKLDWLWVRGLEPTRSGIARSVGFSDHWPVWTVVRLPAQSTKAQPNSAR
jgi:endonuclease/exonuclease/phosphatase family metal-dependent hydrolase